MGLIFTSIYVQHFVQVGFREKKVARFCLKPENTSLKALKQEKKDEKIQIILTRNCLISYYDKLLCSFKLFTQRVEKRKHFANIVYLKYLYFQSMLDLSQ